MNECRCSCCRNRGDTKMDTREDLARSIRAEALGDANSRHNTANFNGDLLPYVLPRLIKALDKRYFIRAQIPGGPGSTIIPAASAQVECVLAESIRALEVPVIPDPELRPPGLGPEPGTSQYDAEMVHFNALERLRVFVEEAKKSLAKCPVVCQSKEVAL